jgi:hypothetical protein
VRSSRFDPRPGESHVPRSDQVAEESAFIPPAAAALKRFEHSRRLGRHLERRQSRRRAFPGERAPVRHAGRAGDLFHAPAFDAFHEAHRRAVRNQLVERRHVRQRPNLPVHRRGDRGKGRAERNEALGDDFRVAAHLQPHRLAGRRPGARIYLKPLAGPDQAAESKRVNLGERRSGAAGIDGAQAKVEKTDARQDRTPRKVSFEEDPGGGDGERAPEGRRRVRAHARTAVIVATTNAGQTSRIRAMSG